MAQDGPQRSRLYHRLPCALSRVLRVLRLSVYVHVYVHVYVPVCVPVRARAPPTGAKRGCEVGLPTSRMQPKFDFGYFPHDLLGYDLGYDLEYDIGHQRTDSCLVQIAPGQGIILFEHDDHEITIAPYSRQIGPYAVLEELGRQPYVLNPLNDCRGV